MRLLLIEDDKDLAKAMQEEFLKHFAVDAVTTGKEGIYLAETVPYDAIILDMGLPDMDGFELCSILRQRGVTSPILVLTGRAATHDKVSALDAGADDYLTKPFEHEELLARLRALMRRNANLQDTVLTLGSLTLNPATRTVTYADTYIPLRRKEFDLLEFLLRNVPRVVTREMILDHVWDRNVNSFTNAVDVHISHLRDQIDKPFNVRLIETVYGFGYRVNPSFGVESSAFHAEDT